LQCNFQFYWAFLVLSKQNEERAPWKKLHQEEQSQESAQTIKLQALANAENQWIKDVKAKIYEVRTHGRSIADSRLMDRSCESIVFCPWSQSTDCLDQRPGMARPTLSS
jgi:hypothetical protein